MANRNRKLTAATAAAAVLSCGAMAARGSDFSWTSPANGGWNTSSNWTRTSGASGNLPGGAAEDTATIQFGADAPSFSINRDGNNPSRAIAAFTLDAPTATFYFSNPDGSANLRRVWVDGTVLLNQGTVVVTRGGTTAGGTFLDVTGTLTNNATIDIRMTNGYAAGLGSSTGGALTFHQDGNVLIGVNGAGVAKYMQHLNVATGFTNSGTITLSNTHPNWANSALNGTADSDTALLVTGGPVINTGSIRVLKGASDGTAFFQDGPVSRPVNHRDLVLQLDNRGLLDVQNAGARAARLGQATATSHTNSGTISIAVDTTLALTADNALTNQAQGALSGKGTLDVSLGSFSNLGRLVPGGQNDVGALTIHGDFTSSDTASLDIELAGSSTYDQFILTGGSTTLSGNLNVSFLGGFIASETDAFTVFLGNYSGTFDNTPDNKLVVGDRQFDVAYNAGSIVLSNFSAIPEPSALGLLALAGLVRRRTRA